MIKKILPTMVGLAMVGGMTAASADVSIFGHIDTSIVAYDDGGTGPNSDDVNLVCTTCSIGFKGSEDLGNGLKAIFSLDFQYDTTDVKYYEEDPTSTPPGQSVATSTNTIKDRDQWLGLSGGFGQVRVGTISTVYKSHGAMIDPLYRTVLQGRDVGLQSSFHSGAGEELQGRATNTVRWDSTDFSGFKLGAHYTFDTNEVAENDDPYGIGGSYENGGILVFADYMGGAKDSTGVYDDSVWKIGGKYSMNNFAVYGQYESEDYDVGDYTVWHIAGSYTMDSNMLYVGYGQDSDEPDGSSSQDSDSLTIAAMHNFSKSAMAYVGYAYNDPDGGDKGDAFALGMKLKF